MPVKNRALTLATRGLLTGAAISIATHGLIQLPIPVGNISDSVHAHTVDSVVLQQIVPPLPPKVIERAGGIPSGETFIDFGVPYRYASNINLILQSYSLYHFDKQQLSNYLYTQPQFLLLDNGTRINKNVKYEIVSEPYFILEGIANSKFTTPQVAQVSPVIGLDVRTLSELRTPSQLRHMAQARLVFSGVSNSTVDSNPPVIIQPTTYRAESFGNAVIEGTTLSEIVKIELGTYAYASELVHIFEGQSYTIFNGKRISITSLQSEGVVGVGSNTASNVQSNPPKDENSFGTILGVDRDAVLTAISIIIDEDT